jgi:Concanavalin A-like lectin/glucanases superfamily/Zinc finger, C3HC4 type (RING finger)
VIRLDDPAVVNFSFPVDMGTLLVVIVTTASLASADCLSVENTLADWSFNEGHGTIVNDDSGSGNTGDLIGSPFWTSGVDQGGLGFNSGDDAVRLSSSALQGPFSMLSITVWVFPTSFSNECDPAGQYGPRVISTTESASIGWALAHAPGSGYLSIDFRGVAHYRTRARLSLLAWSHVAVTYDGSSLKTYINGSVADTRPSTGVIRRGVAPMIGNEPQSNGAVQNSGHGAFQGVLDELQVFSCALSSSEVIALALLSQSLPTSVVASSSAGTPPTLSTSSVGSTTVAAASTISTADPTPQVPHADSSSTASASPSSTPWWIAVLIVVVCIGLAVAGYVVWRRRRSTFRFTPIPALDEDEVLEDCGASSKKMAAVEEDRHEMIEIDSESSSNDSDEVQTVPLDDVDDSEACTVCLSAKIDHTFLPCGHNSCCGRCAKKCQKHGACPICRKPIESVVKTFRS